MSASQPTDPRPSLTYLRPEVAALKARLDDVLGGDIRGKATEKKTAEDVATEATAPVTSPSSSSEGEEEDAMSFFEKLAND